MPLHLSCMRYSSPRFGFSVTADDSHHKRGQIFGSLVRTQIQTSGNPQASMCSCNRLMGLLIAHCCS